MNLKPLQVAAGIILNARSQVLLAQRPLHKRLGGFWEFPGGKLEPGEDSVQALKRELMEELRLPVGVLHYLGAFSFEYDFGPLTLFVHVVRALGEPELTSDVRAWRWVLPREVQEAELAPADVQPWRTYQLQFKA